MNFIISPIRSCIVLYGRRREFRIFSKGAPLLPFLSLSFISFSLLSSPFLFFPLPFPVSYPPLHKGDRNCRDKYCGISLLSIARKVLARILFRVGYESISLESIQSTMCVCVQSYIQTVYSRFPDSYFPGWFFSWKDVSRKVVSRMVIFPDRTFPGKTIPGWSLSRKDVSRVVIFPDETISYD